MLRRNSRRGEMTRVCPAVVAMLSSPHAHNPMHPRRAIDRTNGRSAEPVTVAEIRSETSKIKRKSRLREQQGHHQVALCFCAACLLMPYDAP
jgi:hypothetical protein